MNTVIYDEDLPLMRQIVDAAKEAKISAVIASDAAVMMYCKQKGVEVHLSTQLNISNVEALKFYSQFADVVVLARELNLRQVKRIYDEIQQELFDDSACVPICYQINVNIHNKAITHYAGKTFGVGLPTISWVK